MKSDTKIAKSHIAKIYSSHFFQSFLPKMHSVRILTKWYAQLRGCCFCLFLFEWLSAKFVMRSPCGLLGGQSSCQRCPVVFNLWQLFVCSVNEYAKLERLISFSVSSLQGAVHLARLWLVGEPLLQTNVQTPPGNIAFSPCLFTSLCYLAAVCTPKLGWSHTGATVGNGA